MVVPCCALWLAQEPREGVWGRNLGLLCPMQALLPARRYA